MKALQADSASPLYHQLMRRIAGDIDKGIYPVGSRIPPEHELENIYHVSRVTVRRALSELTNEGLLERKQGKGTFVSAPRMSQDLKNVHSFHDFCRQNGMTPGARVIHVKEVAPELQETADLQLRDGDRVVETLRVRLANNEPVVLERNNFSMAYAWLEEADLTGSLYALLREYGVEPKQATHDLSLCEADARQAELLAVAPGTPLLKLREVIYDQRGRPLHTSLQLIRGDRFTFRI